MQRLLTETNAFEIVNNDASMLQYQIDFHGGLRKQDAEEIFNKCYFRILAGLRSKRFQGNSRFRNQHIVKVICGYGHHNKQKVGRLRMHFVTYLTYNMFDFAYSEKHGTFLIRVKY